MKRASIRQLNGVHWIILAVCFVLAVFAEMSLFGLCGAIGVTIMETEDPEKIRALGRMVFGYDEHVWNGVRQLIVYDGLIAKFTQNEELRMKLKETGTKFIAKCSETDLFWGIGVGLDNPDRFDTEKWKGQNQLGYALMYVRERI